MSAPAPRPSSTFRPGPSGASSRLRLKNPSQEGREVSPWSTKEKAGRALWAIVQATIYRWVPRQLSGWHRFWLRTFGATIEGRPYIHPRATIEVPWLLTIEDKAALAHHVEVYNLARITLKRSCVVSQFAYLCAGTHDLSDPQMPLVVGDIVIGPEAFIGARAMVLPGVIVGEGAVLGAGAVTGKDLDPWQIYAGNPAKLIRRREHPQAPPAAPPAP